MLGSLAQGISCPHPPAPEPLVFLHDPPHQVVVDAVEALVPRPQVTEYGVMTIVPQFAQTEGIHPPSGSPGAYDVVFVLGVPGVCSVATSLNVDQLINSGDSLLSGSDLQIELFAEDGRVIGSARCISNNQRRLAQIRLTVSAENFAAAEKHAYDMVMSPLSRVTAATVGAASARTWSVMPSTPAGRPSQSTTTAVCPRSGNASTTADAAVAWSPAEASPLVRICRTSAIPGQSIKFDRQCSSPAPALPPAMNW